MAHLGQEKEFVMGGSPERPTTPPLSLAALHQPLRPVGGTPESTVTTHSTAPIIHARVEHLHASAGGTATGILAPNATIFFLGALPSQFRYMPTGTDHRAGGGAAAAAAAATAEREGLPIFIPRPEFEEEIKRRLEASSRENTFCFLIGPSGSGKTAVLLDYMHKHAPNCAYFNAENTEVLKTEFEQYAREMIGHNEGSPIVTDFKAYLTSLNTTMRKTLVFDNVSDWKQIENLLPPSGVSVIVIFKSPDLHGVPPRPPTTTPSAIELTIMTPMLLEEALSLAQESLRLVNDEIPRTPADLSNLATTLQYCPLAIAQACNLLATKKLPIADYLKQYNAHKKDLAKLHIQDPSFISFGLAYRDLLEMRAGTDAATKAQAEHALTLLHACAFLDPDGIPSIFLFHLFPKTGVEETGIEAVTEEQKKIYTEAHRLLVQYGLISNTLTASTGVKIHRIAQQYLRLHAFNEEVAHAVQQQLMFLFDSITGLDRHTAYANYHLVYRNYQRLLEHDPKPVLNSTDMTASIMRKPGTDDSLNSALGFSVRNLATSFVAYRAHPYNRIDIAHHAKSLFATGKSHYHMGGVDNFFQAINYFDESLHFSNEDPLLLASSKSAIGSAKREYAMCIPVGESIPYLNDARIYMEEAFRAKESLIKHQEDLITANTKDVKLRNDLKDLKFSLAITLCSLSTTYRYLAKLGVPQGGSGGEPYITLAIRTAAESLSLRQEICSPSSTLIAISLTRLAQAYHDNKDTTNALAKAKEAINIFNLNLRHKKPVSAIDIARAKFIEGLILLHAPSPTGKDILKSITRLCDARNSEIISAYTETWFSQPKVAEICFYLGEAHTKLMETYSAPSETENRTKERDAAVLNYNLTLSIYQLGAPRHPNIEIIKQKLTLLGKTLTDIPEALVQAEALFSSAQFYQSLKDHKKDNAIAMYQKALELFTSQDPHHPNIAIIEDLLGTRKGSSSDGFVLVEHPEARDAEVLPALPPSLFRFTGALTEAVTGAAGAVTGVLAGLLSKLPGSSTPSPPESREALAIRRTFSEKDARHLTPAPPTARSDPGSYARKTETFAFMPHPPGSDAPRGGAGGPAGGVGAK